MHCASRAAIAALALGAALPAAVRAAQADAGVAIELRPRVEVREPQVRLGDIAYLSTQNLPLLRQLMALPLGAAPRLGAPAALDRDTIARWVGAHSPAREIRWSGTDETLIESAAQRLDGESVVAAARSALADWLSRRSVRADVQPVSAARDLVLPAGVPTLRVRPLAPQALPARRMLVWVDAWVDDRFVRSTAVSFEVGAWAPLTVAASNVERGTAMDPIVLNGALERREIDLTSLRHGKPIGADLDASADLATGKQRLRRPLRPGEVLTDAHLEAAPAVARGNWAHLIARNGDVSIQSRAQVLQDGRQGEVVRVKVPGASGEVLARVTGPGQLEVQP